MKATVFDTHQAVKALRDAGADEAMAEAIVNTASAAAGAGRDMIATKAGLATLEAKLDRFATREDLANAVNRMLIAQLATAGLLFAAIRLL